MAKKQINNSEIDIVSKELEALQKQSLEYEKSDKKSQGRLNVIIACIASLVVIAVSAFVIILIVDANKSPISYGPNASQSEMTKEKTKEHERRIKIIDENGGIREGVNFVGYHARFNDNGDLVVSGYMRNFTGHEIYNITGNITVSNETGDHIGSAYFEFTEDKFGRLKNEKSRPWTIIISNEYVNVEITELDVFRVKTEFNFSY